MFRLTILTLSLGCFLCASFEAQAQDDELKSVVRKAITAHGGEKALSKFGAATTKFKGTIEINGKSRDISGENTLQKPDKLKSALTIDIDGMAIPVVVVFNGKNLWRSINGTTTEVKDEKIVKETRENLLVEGAGSLGDYLKAPYELSALGEVMVMDKPAVGIRVSKKGQRDISFFFDKKTNLVVKTEMRIYEAETGQEVTQEKFIIGYKDTNGLKTAARVLIHKDGKRFMDIEITNTQIFDKLDDSTFAKP